MTGCGIHLGEKPPEKKEIRVDFHCSADVSTFVRTYVHAEQKNVSETEKFFECLKESLLSFQTYVAGDVKERYTPEELKNFVEHVLITDRPLTNQLLHQFMLIKVALIGGSTEFLRHDEITGAIILMDQLKTIAKNLWPYISIINPYVGRQKKIMNLPLPSTDLAVAALDQAAIQIGDLLASSHNPYAFNDFKNFIQEFRSFAKWDSAFPSAGSVDSWIDFWIAFKDFAVRPSAQTEIVPEEWPRLMRQAVGWYSTWLRFEFSVHGQDIFVQPGLNQTTALVNGVADLLERSIASHPKTMIEFDQILNLFQKMKGVDLISDPVTPEVLSSVVRVVFEKILGPTEVQPKRRVSEGIDLAAVAHLKNEYEIFKQAQLFLNQLFFEKNKKGLSVIKDWLKSPSLRESIDPLDLARKVGGPDEQYLGLFFQAIRIDRPLFAPNLENKIRVLLLSPKNLDQIQFSFEDLSMKNMLFAVIRLLVKGYAGDDERRLQMVGLTRSEVQDFYEDFRLLGEQIHILDPRSPRSGSRSFLEGKLFTYAGHGYEEFSADVQLKYLSLAPGIELFGFLISGGLTSRQLYYELAKPSLCPPQEDYPVDIFGDKELKKECIMPYMVEHIQDNLDHLPEWQKYYRQLSLAEKNKFLESLLAAAKDPQLDPNWVEKPDLTGMIVVLQYIEAIFTRYDLNGDGILNESEINNAYPTFRGLIRDMAAQIGRPLTSESDVRYVFNHILLYHQIPPGTWRDLIRKNFRLRDFHLTRLQLTEAFHMIIQQILEIDRLKNPGQ